MPYNRKLDVLSISLNKTFTLFIFFLIFFLSALNLTYSSQVGQFVLLGDSVDLWCHRVGYDYFVGTVEMFKENERCAYLLYSADKCEIKILKSGYEFACENKTNPQRGMSVFTIKDVKQDDFKMWRCMHKESAMTSPVLDLRQSKCVKSLISFTMQQWPVQFLTCNRVRV